MAARVGLDSNSGWGHMLREDLKCILEHKYLWVSFLAYHTVVLNLYQSPESPGKFVKTKYWDPLPEFLIQ